MFSRHPLTPPHLTSPHPIPHTPPHPIPHPTPYPTPYPTQSTHPIVPSKEAYVADFQAMGVSSEYLSAPVSRWNDIRSVMATRTERAPEGGGGSVHRYKVKGHAVWTGDIHMCQNKSDWGWRGLLWGTRQRRRSSLENHKAGRNQMDPKRALQKASRPNILKACS